MKRERMFEGAFYFYCIIFVILIIALSVVHTRRIDNLIDQHNAEISVLCNRIDVLENKAAQSNLDVISISLELAAYKEDVIQDFGQMYDIVLDRMVTNEELYLLVEKVVLKYVEVIE